MVTKARSQAKSQPPSPAQVRLRQREILSPITTDGFVVALGPQHFQDCYVATISAAFAEYRFLGNLVFEYRPHVSSQAEGETALSLSPTDPGVPNYRDVVRSAGVVVTRVSAPKTLSIPASKLGGWAGHDAQPYYLQLASTYHSPGTIGHIWVNYDIEFRFPITLASMFMMTSAPVTATRGTFLTDRTGTLEIPRTFLEGDYFYAYIPITPSTGTPSPTFCATQNFTYTTTDTSVYCELHREPGYGHANITTANPGSITKGLYRVYKVTATTTVQRPKFKTDTGFTTICAYSLEEIATLRPEILSLSESAPGTTFKTNQHKILILGNRRTYPNLAAASTSTTGELFTALAPSP